MKTIVKSRNQGKTTELIKLSGETGAYIVCSNEREVHAIAEYAREQKINIPFPLTFWEFDNKQYYGAGIRGFLFDNIDDYIQNRTNVPVLAITLTENNELPNLDWDKNSVKNDLNSPSELRNY